MKYLILVFTSLLFSSASFAQEDWSEPSKESQEYHAYRSKTTVPPYGLEKIKTLIATLKDDPETSELALSAAAYNKLSLREQFTYHMIHAETYSQNCDAMPPIQDEHLKIFGRLPDAFNEYSWSKRQFDFMIKNRDSVMAIIKESMNRSKRMGVNYKMAVVEINATEMIPYLISFYKKDKKDHDILTVLMLLMLKNEYATFMESQSYSKLYGENASYQAYINFNKENEALIIERATKFFNGK